MSKYTITLADGSKIANLTMSGNMYVSNSKLTRENFEGKLSHVKIEHDEIYRDEDGKEQTVTQSDEFDNMALTQLLDGDKLSFADYAGKTLFNLRPAYTPEEFFQVKTESRLDYLEMIAG